MLSPTSPPAGPVPRRPTFQAVGAAAAGNWPWILARLGVAPEFLAPRHGPCPGCGGRDRYRFDDKDGRGSWICGGGGELSSGDGFALLSHIHGWSRIEALRAVADVLGFEASTGTPTRRIAPQPPRVAAPSTSSTQALALSIWARARREDAYVAAHAYAQRKGIDWAAGAGRATVSTALLGKDVDVLVVPIREVDTFNVAAVQLLAADGRKQTLGPLKGHAFIIGNERDTGCDWYLVEGWADAVSMARTYRSTCVFAAMGGGKVFDSLAAAIVEQYAPKRLIVLEDAP